MISVFSNEDIFTVGALTFEPCESGPTTVCVCVLLSVVELE